jgi:endonuclease III related protein
VLERRPLLLDIYRRLLSRHGPQGWWPGETPFEVVVGAILTQSTAWSNVERAIANLKSAGVLSPAGLHSLPTDELAQLVRPSGYFNQKARKLKAFMAVLMAEYGGSPERLWSLPAGELRERLLVVHGVGPETADSICLYAAGKPCFVVDAYTRRVFSRLGLVEPSVAYEELRSLFTGNLPVDPSLFNEYHALVVRQGKDVCRKRAPLCGECCLANLCQEASGK